jgi:hypothetical protein
VRGARGFRYDRVVIRGLVSAWPVGCVIRGAAPRIEYMLRPDRVRWALSGFGNHDHSCADHHPARSEASRTFLGS